MKEVDLVLIEEILPNIFRLQVPLPRNPLRTLNSYLIKGGKRNLLVDTGFNWPECKEALLAGMAELGIDWAEVDFYITHVHGDHSGLVYDLASSDSRVYCSRTDADIMRASMTSPWWLETNNSFIMHGFPRELISNQAENMTDFISGSNLNFTYVQDGDIIEIGSYHLVCTSTPGHSPGHMCLYDPEHKLFISGDHILAHISSNITFWPGVDDSLGQYLDSLDRVNAMDISLVLPGHRELISDYRGRIAELKHHHKKRLDEILHILQAGTMNAYQIASHMHWDMNYNSWDEFPGFQRWFATGEAVAHLEYLAQRNKVCSTLTEERLIYSLPL
jgi:glyoxylase-like metal-dependent hydrolase (beta-lactamase superfamily II)